MISVEVAYATPEKQVIKRFEVAEGTNALEAVQISKIVDEFPEIDINSAKMGIFSKAFSPKLGPEKHEMKEGERIEIYRPLIADPKESRRRRAEKSD